ncbi:MAG: hypothetical protein EHM91_03870 [Planctomycetota bacterium]|nr:MAG: hypothetical protein EHM91_03870 [Planctomycetota bacterium]
MRRGRTSVLLLALAFGCSKEDPPAPPPPPPAEKPAPPEPLLPPLAEVSFRDWAEVDDEKFLELPAPAPAPKLQWDFSAGQRYGYDFSETLSQRLERQAGGKRALNTAREKNRGLFEFAAGRDRTALAVSKIQTQEASLNDQPVPRESYAKKPASVAECVVTEDGTAESKSAKGLADARMYFQSLFALQSGARDLAPGKITTRVAGYAKVQRYDCARIESEFEITTDKPSEKLLLRGRVIGYFALAERKFVRASAAVATSSRGNALSKEGVWITSSLDAVTSYRARLLD